MLFNVSLDVYEDAIMNYDPKLLDILLFDQTTKRNIIWATDDYAERGSEYSASSEIHPELITGINSMLIRPRIAKSIEAQESRTRGRAEVFTPCWICNAQNNMVDEQWFGRPSVFNTEGNQQWKTTEDRIQFPGGYQKTWQDYVNAKRLEITCGEAPYLVSRYDTVTGAMIPIKDRIGLLDRKLRVVNENTENAEDWFNWSLRAFQSVYGYEFQGDNLLLARENLLATFIEYYQDRFAEGPSVKQLHLIARTISWNIWQMDGMKFVVPYSCKPQKVEQQLSLFDFGEEQEEIIPCYGCRTGNCRKHTGSYCRIFDWRENASLRFVDMVKGERV